MWFFSHRLVLNSLTLLIVIYAYLVQKLAEFPDVVSLFDRLITITVICWTIYPILFVVGPNGSVLTGSTGFLEVAVVLDVMAKGIWGFLQTINSRALQDAMGAFFFLFFSLSLLHRLAVSVTDSRWVGRFVRVGRQGSAR